jgi:dUTP pyrophosphatase
MIAVCKTHPRAVIPVRGTAGAAAHDLSYCGDVTLLIAPGATAFIPTGLSIDLSHNVYLRSFPDGGEETRLAPASYLALILPRSGLACKHGLAPANSPGLIDSDYRGEIIVCLRNFSDEVQTVEPFDRIAQLLILQAESVSFNEVPALPSSPRGEGGFGSTGL